MISKKPFLIRALRDWALENGLTPQILVDANFPAVNVPINFVKDGHIVLNIHDQAIEGLEISNDWVLFEGRFAGVVHQVDIPIDSIVAIFARENGEGLVFRDETSMYDTQEDEQVVEEQEPPQFKKKPDLRIVR